MQDKDLLTYSQQLKQEADKVILLTKVNDFFSKLGTITYVGSYRFDLLYRRDIDFFVQSDDCNYERAKTLTHSLLDSNIFQTIGFADWVTQQAENSLKGYYWQLVYFFSGKRWKFDVWYTAEKNIKAIEKAELIINKLKENPQKKLEILELKQKNCIKDSYLDNLNGFKIYQKVLGEI